MLGPRIIPGWTFILTYGYSLDVYGKGKERKAIDRETGREVARYKRKGS